MSDTVSGVARITYWYLYFGNSVKERVAQSRDDSLKLIVPRSAHHSVGFTRAWREGGREGGEGGREERGRK